MHAIEKRVALQEVRAHATEHAGKSKQPSQPETESDVVFLSKSMTIRDDQYMDITSLAAYNKLLRRKPDTVSALVREALDQYLASVDDAYRHIGK